MRSRRGNTAFLATLPTPNPVVGVPATQTPRSLVLWADDLGELDLSCEAGYIVTSLELGFPVIREVMFEMAYMNGIWDETGYFGESAVTIGLGLDGSKAPVQLLLDRLRAYVLPRRRARLRYLPNGYTVPREMILRGADCRAVFDNPRVMSVVAQWINPSGRSYEYIPDSPNGLRCTTFGFDQPVGRTYDRVHSWSYPPSITNAINVINAGNAISPWTMRISGDVQQPFIDFINPNVPTYTLDLNRTPLTIPAGGWVDIDSAARSVVDNNGVSLYNNLANALMPSLPLGTTTLRARAVSSGAAARVEFCYRSAWV